MLTAANVIQSASGSTGTGTVASFNMTLGTAAQAGSGIIGVAARTSGSNGFDFQGFGAGGFSMNASPSGTMTTRAVLALGGETTWTVDLLTANDAACWTLFEVSDVAGIDYTQPGEYIGLTNDAGISQGGVNAGGQSVKTNNTGVVNAAGNEIVVASGAMVVASGTPPAFDFILDQTGGGPGTWVRAGSSVATSRASGKNIRLEVHHKFTEGVQAILDANIGWVAAGETALGFVSAFIGFDVKPGKLLTRAAVPTSMH